MNAAVDAALAPVASTDFAETRYAVVRGALAPGAAKLAADHALALARDPRAFRPEQRFVARGRYADAVGEQLLVALQPKVEAASGRPLLPCYSFLRIYEAGASLYKHLDRPSCEVSVTLTLGYDAPGLWPIHVARGGVERAIELDVGDMLVYKGAQVVHWRDPLVGRRWVQLFLHYVDAEGPYTDFKFDGRDALGAFDPTRDQRRNLPPPSPQPTDPCPCLSDRAWRDCHGRAGAAPLTDEAGDRAP